jgi:hypothetical protein
MQDQTTNEQDVLGLTDGHNREKFWDQATVILNVINHSCRTVHQPSNRLTTHKGFLPVGYDFFENKDHIWQRKPLVAMIILLY